jgi:hypothetical protein
VVVADLGFAAQPAEVDDLPADVPVEIDQTRLEVLQLDRFVLERLHRFLEPLGEVRPLGVQLVLAVVVRMVGRIDLLPPEILEALQLRVDFAETYGPRPKAREELLQLRDPGVRLFDGPQARGVHLAGIRRRVRTRHSTRKSVVEYLPTR